MEHSFIDRHSDLDSLIHRLDPRTKLVATLAFILAVVVTPISEWPAFVGYSLLIGVLIVLSNLPILHVLRRASMVIPFVILIGVFNIFRPGEPIASLDIWHWQISITQEGLTVFLSVLVKACLSSLSLIVLSSTTRFPNLLKGLEQLRMPRLMVMILSFGYRYMFVLIDEAMRMWRARESRNFGGRWAWRVRTIGNMVGMLFVRSYERGERVYAAMLSRGYDGQAKALGSLSFGQRDAYFAIAAALCLVCTSLVIMLY